jgi:hypothetical protein
MKMNPQAEKGWMDADRMTFVGLILAVLGLIVAIATPEIRCLLHLQSEACSPAHPARHHVQQAFQVLKQSFSHGLVHRLMPW